MMHLSFILQNFSNSAKIRNISESLSSNSDGQCGGHLIVFYKALNGNSSELVRQRFDKSHLFEKQNRIAEHEERLYPSLTLTGDISSLGNLHRKKKFYRQRERERKRERKREMQKDRRATSGTEVLGVMHSYIIDAISSLERLAGVYEKAVHYFSPCGIHSLAI